MSNVRIRPAQAKDRPAVETLCAQIWEGEDYVPEVWDTWLVPAGGAPPLRRLTAVDVPPAWALIDRSQRRRAASGLYEVAWKWKNLTRERLAHHLGADDGWGMDDADELTALALACWVRGEGVLNVGFVDGSEDALVTVLRGLRELAAQLGYAGIRFKPVDEPALVAAAEASGYERSWDRDIWVFELPL